MGASALLRTFPIGSHADAPTIDPTRVPSSAAGRPRGLPGGPAMPGARHGWPARNRPHRAGKSPSRRLRTPGRAPMTRPPVTGQPAPVNATVAPMAGAATQGARPAAVDLLAVTPERVRRALWRSFLRCGFTGELDDAVHAAPAQGRPGGEQGDGRPPGSRPPGPALRRGRAGRLTCAAGPATARVAGQAAGVCGRPGWPARMAWLAEPGGLAGRSGWPARLAGCVAGRPARVPGVAHRGRAPARPRSRRAPAVSHGPQKAQGEMFTAS